MAAERRDVDKWEAEPLPSPISSPGISAAGTELTEHSDPSSAGGAAVGDEDAPDVDGGECYWQYPAAADGTTTPRRSTARGSSDSEDWRDDSSSTDASPRLGKLPPPTYPPPATIEGLRVRSDLRQIGSVLLVLGVGAYVSSLMLQAELVQGGMGDASVEGVKLAQLTATTLQTVMGLFASAVGFVALTVTPLGPAFHRAAKWLVFVINAAGPIGLVITIVRVVQGARVPPEQNQFIPQSLDPTETDVRFVAAMGIVGISSVCSSLIGGLTVMSLNLCAYLGRQPMDKNRGYYIVRFGYYNVIVFLGGVSQLALGVYLLLRYGGGFYDEPIHITVYTVFCPEMAVVAGAVQTVIPFYGLCRTTEMARRGAGSIDDHSFLYASAVLWIVTTAFQVAVQPAFATGRGEYTAEGATYSAVYMGTFVMPPYLDYLVRNTAVRVRPEYFGLSSSEVEEKADPLARCFGLTSEQMLAEKRLHSAAIA